MRKNKLDIFSQESFDYINSLIESKIELLHTCDEYNMCFKALMTDIDALGNNLLSDDKEALDTIIHEFYIVENYTTTFAFSLGVKYGEELKKL